MPTGPLPPFDFLAGALSAALGSDRFTFDFLPNSNENSKRVTVASKLVSRNVAGLLFILSGQIYAITKTFSNSDKPISPVRLR